MASPPVTAPLSILSFNMQVGVGTKRYREYVTRGWRHLLPSRQVRDNLLRIGDLLAGHDIVGLQEIDAGSRRSGYVNQIEQIAGQAGFGYWYIQVNRDLGRVAQHGLGLISRYEPFEITEHKLPGRLPGRGALLARFGNPSNALTVVVTHLSLGAGSRAQQLEALCDLVGTHKNVILMGDTNCTAAALRADEHLGRSRLKIHPEPLPTFPSWRPRRGIDHILTSPSLTVRNASVIDATLSDHRPVQMNIDLPQALAACMPRPVVAPQAPPRQTPSADPRANDKPGGAATE